MKKLVVFLIPLLGLMGLGVVVYQFLSGDALTLSPPAAGPPVLRMQADPALRYPLQAPDIEHEYGVLGRFERRSGIRVRVTYTAPNATDSARRGETAIPDIIVTADDRSEPRDDHAVRIPIAYHIPLILVNVRAEHEIAHPGDLLDPAVRWAVADPQRDVLGQFTLAWLPGDVGSAAAMLEVARFVGANADKVARAVEQNRVDAAVVWRDTALRHTRQTRRVEWPDADVRGAIIHAVIPADAAHRAEAEQLARFLASPAGGEVFELYGFGTHAESVQGFSVQAFRLDTFLNSEHRTLNTMGYNTL